MLANDPDTTGVNPGTTDPAKSSEIAPEQSHGPLRLAVAPWPPPQRYGWCREFIRFALETTELSPRPPATPAFRSNWRAARPSRFNMPAATSSSTPAVVPLKVGMVPPPWRL